MIRNNNDICGIIIDNKEYKISQYADDTQLFLNGSENSFRKTLDVLQKFYEMSGLKKNVEKTKAIWIGSLSSSPTRLCHNYTLDLLIRKLIRFVNDPCFLLFAHNIGHHVN